MSFRANVRTDSDLASANHKTIKYDKKLAKILTAATQVFADQGYDRASIRGVAEQAKISVAGLYYYVSSKEELLYLVQFHAFDKLIRQFQEQSQQLSDPAARLRLLIHNHLERFLGNLAELIVCSREIDRLVGDYRRQIEDKHREYFGLALGLFRELAEQQQTHVDPRMAALAMFGSINWVHTWYRPETGPSAAQMADDLVRLYLQGVAPNPGKGTP
jgi:AcrR family transcriptional regulator